MSIDTSLDRYPRPITLNDGTPVQIRPLAVTDAEGLITLFRDVTDEDLRVLRDDVTNPATLRHWAEQQNHQRMLPMVADVNGDLVAMYSLHRTPGTPFAHLGQFRMFVRGDWRERGLGGQLIDDVIELARDLGVEQLTAELTMDSVGMITAFGRRGFEREAILPVYQLVVMRYNLGPRPGKDALAIDHADHLPPRRLWPDLMFEDSLTPIPEEVNLAELLLDDNIKRGWGRRPAIYYHGEIVSYDLLQNEVLRLANSLNSLGIKAGQLIWMHMPNVAQAIAANFAVQRLGAVSMPTPPQWAPRELTFIAQESGATAAITTIDLLDDVLEIRATTNGRMGPVIVHGMSEHRPEEQLYSYSKLVARGEANAPLVRRNRREIGLLLYTSALGGHPRGTAHRLDSLLAVLDCFGKQVWRVNEEDIISAMVPLGFAQAFVVFGLMPFHFGASVALHDNPLAEDGVELVETIRRHRVTLLFAPPNAYRQLLAHPTLTELDIASVRLCSTGGEPLTTDTYNQWLKRFDQPLFEGFGTTENLYAFTSNAVGMRSRPGSMGRAVPGFQVKVLNDHGNELAPGEIGYLCVRGPTGTLYWNNPDAQRRAVRNGWNVPGDFAYMDSDGYFWFVARSDDLIKTRSYRIDPTEVEAAIMEYPRVQDVAVIGLPDEMRGQRPVAYVVLHDQKEAEPMTARAIITSLRGRLGDYKLPDEVIFVETLPRNAQGQLLRRLLRDRVRD